MEHYGNRQGECSSPFPRTPQQAAWGATPKTRGTLRPDVGVLRGLEVPAGELRLLPRRQARQSCRSSSPCSATASGRRGRDGRRLRHPHQATELGVSPIRGDAPALRRRIRASGEAPGRQGAVREPDASGRAPGTNDFFRGAPVPRHRPTNHRMSRATRNPRPLSRCSISKEKRFAERSISGG